MRIKIIVALFFVSLAVDAQEIAQKVALEICNCVDTIENIDSLEAKVNRCSSDALETVLEASSDELQEIYSSDDAVEETINKAMENLLSECPKIKKFILEDRKEKFYKLSESDAANKYYELGNDLYAKDDFKGALKAYESAIRKDPSFIYAIDNAGLTYRKLGDNKKAIKYYNRSLDIYPEGSLALQNLAVAYLAGNDLKSALECYQKFAYYYPEDPEGYFGIGRIYVAAGEYEQAMDYVFAAHKIYSLSNSEYAKDSQQLISVIYNKMREKNKLDEFIQKAKQYGIDYN
jgi:tetratricopeptide (TPR) repeat protein